MQHPLALYGSDSLSNIIRKAKHSHHCAIYHNWYKSDLIVVEEALRVLELNLEHFSFAGDCDSESGIKARNVVPGTMATCSSPS